MFERRSPLDPQKDENKTAKPTLPKKEVPPFSTDPEFSQGDDHYTQYGSGYIDEEAMEQAETKRAEERLLRKANKTSWLHRLKMMWKHSDL